MLDKIVSHFSELASSLQVSDSGYKRPAFTGWHRKRSQCTAVQFSAPIEIDRNVLTCKTTEIHYWTFDPLRTQTSFQRQMPKHMWCGSGLQEATPGRLLKYVTWRIHDLRIDQTSLHSPALPLSFGWMAKSHSDRGRRRKQTSQPGCL